MSYKPRQWKMCICNNIYENLIINLCIVALDAKKDKDAALEELQRQMQLQREEEVGELKQRLESENSQLRRDFSDKSSELELALVQLKRLESELAKREQGLGSAASSLEALKAELMTAQGDLMASRKEKEGAVKERDRLLVCKNMTKSKYSETHLNRPANKISFNGDDYSYLLVV